mmetsp:Transcript_55094/g.155005  ORF Transcript_55094/g.155005 Transcript_55094/m.155005 type:complete len:224 (-) Transcript_55094:1754-2425(-)
MSSEFLTATWRKSGLVGAVLLRSWPASIRRDTSAVEPGAMSGTMSCAPGPKPKGFLFTWMAKLLSITAEEFERVIISCTWPSLRAMEAMTPKPLFPFCPGDEALRTGVLTAAAWAGAPAGALSPPRSSRSRPPAGEGSAGALLRPLGAASAPSWSWAWSSSCFTSRRLAWRSSSSSSESSPMSSRTCVFALYRVTNSSCGLWYTLLMNARSEISLSSKLLSMI